MLLLHISHLLNGKILTAIQIHDYKSCETLILLTQCSLIKDFQEQKHTSLLLAYISVEKVYNYHHTYPDCLGGFALTFIPPFDSRVFFNVSISVNCTLVPPPRVLSTSPCRMFARFTKIYKPSLSKKLIIFVKRNDSDTISNQTKISYNKHTLPQGKSELFFKGFPVLFSLCFNVNISLKTKFPAVVIFVNDLSLKVQITKIF